MTALIGLHYVDMVYSEAHRAGHLKHLRELQPRWVNIFGGAQYDQAKAFAFEVRREVPVTNVIFRHFKHGGDDGMWTRGSPEWWIKDVCLAHGYQNTDWWIVTDNEANAPDLRPYAEWHTKAIELASKEGIKLAVGRFSTHNPATGQINAGQLDPMWRALAEHPEHIWSPNAYFDIGNHDGLEHLNVGARWMQAITGKRPKVVIGELAYAMNLDPHKGYKANLQVTGPGVVRTVRELLRIHLDGVIDGACWYCAGPWPLSKDTFGANDDMLKALVELGANDPKPPVIDGLPVPAPDPLPDLKPERRALLTRSMNLRETPSNTGVLVTTVDTGSVVKVQEPVTPINAGGYAWVYVHYATYAGWMAVVKAEQFDWLDDPALPDNPEYVTLVQYQADMQALTALVGDLTNQINSYQSDTMAFLNEWVVGVGDKTTALVVSELVARLNKSTVEDKKAS